MIVSLLSQKGGVGKSTLARLLAVEFARQGWQTLIADLDAAQGTSTQWQIRRTTAQHDPEVDVIRYRSVDRAVQAASAYDLALFDGPAHAERGGRTMARSSHLVLIPSGYSLDDLEPQIQLAYELEAEGIDPARIRFALCRVRGSAAEGQGVRGMLKRAGQTALDAELRELATIRQAHMAGLSAGEVSHPKIRDEAAALASEVAKLLLPDA